MHCRTCWSSSSSTPCTVWALALLYGSRRGWSSPSLCTQHGNRCGKMTWKMQTSPWIFSSSLSWGCCMRSRIILQAILIQEAADVWACGFSPGYSAATSQVSYLTESPLQQRLQRQQAMLHSAGFPYMTGPVFCRNFVETDVCRLAYPWFTDIYTVTSCLSQISFRKNPLALPRIERTLKQIFSAL